MGLGEWYVLVDRVVPCVLIVVELLTHVALVIGLYALYPLRVQWSRGGVRLGRLLSLIPSSFDPAPLLYPIFIPVLAALSLANHSPAVVLLNILLGLSSLPAPVIPLHDWTHGLSLSHWTMTVVPILVSEHFSWNASRPKPLTLRGLDAETMILVFPLQQALIPTLDFLLASSILPAELHLLTSALINLFLFAASPQAEILKALMWLGSMCIFVFCRHILRWEVALARIPSWKFRRSPSKSQSRKNYLNFFDHRLCRRLSGSSEEAASDSDAPGDFSAPKSHKTMPPEPARGEPGSAVDNVTTEDAFRSFEVHKRRHTISAFEDVAHSGRVRTTPSGRRKRSMAPGLTSFLSLTVPQAQVRKWLYALYVYIAILGILVGPVKKYVSDRALLGHEPVGWVLGYMFGNVSWFRFWTLMWNLDHWIVLPPLAVEGVPASCAVNWVERIRQSYGEANTRLLLSAHYVLVFLTGMAVVLRLTSVAEVDTRRKVFHGMMVMMFLPTVYIDPTFCALGLVAALSAFLLSDLFRASQLPPISRPLTHFLAPYVDGRDHKGPVIVSHIFLLIGCSIPLWLSLADIDRTGEPPWDGWNARTRDVSMVSGIVCVGMGDAAASLIGRRFGRHKWFWAGGKSLEGSLAFAAAVSCGLIFARIWLHVGRWPVSGSTQVDISWVWMVIKAVLAAGGASTTEAILTGCNDNVVVPVVLWLLVRGLGL